MVRGQMTASPGELAMAEMPAAGGESMTVMAKNGCKGSVT